MRINEGFIVKFTSINGSTSRPVALRHVAALDHKVLDDAVEGAALVVQRLVPVTYREKVIYRFRHRVVVQLHENSTPTDATNTNVEEGPLQALLMVDGRQRVRAGLRDVIILIRQVVVVVYLSRFLR